MTPPTPRARLLQLLDRDDAGVDLAEAALLVAGDEYPGLDPRPYLDRLDGFSDRVAARLRGGPDPVAAIAALNAVLFEEERFGPNQKDYYDPRNSFLNEVLDRRMGIPITLSLLYIDVARRAGLSAAGVGLPGHFVAALLSPGRVHYIDAFDGGRLLTEEECAEKVANVFGGKMALTPDHLRPIGPRAILVRLLTNLKNIYVESRSYAKAHAVIDKLAMLRPEAWTEVRDRGLVLYQMRRYRPALRDLESYLTHAPDASDRPDVAKLKDLIARRLNESA
ncbi:MAG TPA: transglutaminase-like domain-containing protein [Elusimicrobiota bacterium]|jgi:regulator of sirC expression with transglutaminase-like and TPR domain|nr:transglutaminase-like domain-containing protein [Elusimicrobiota bacterium]HNA60744.1 transglutaminase-like domain-containing protein [Elusimicrobiota bacterium]